MYQLCQYQLLALLYTCMNSNWYFSLLFAGLLHWWCHGNTPMMSLVVGNPSLTVISFGTDSNTCLFIWFCHYSETFFLFSYMHQFFLLVGQLNIHNLCKTIAAIPTVNLLQISSFVCIYVTEWHRYTRWTGRLSHQTSNLSQPSQSAAKGLWSVLHLIPGSRGCR